MYMNKLQNYKQTTKLKEDLWYVCVKPYYIYEYLSGSLVYRLDYLSTTC